MPEGPNTSRPKPLAALEQRAERARRDVVGLPPPRGARRTGRAPVVLREHLPRPILERRRGQTSKVVGIKRGVISRRPILMQEGSKTTKNSQVAKKVVKGKPSLKTRVLRKVGIKRKGQR